MGMVAKKEEIKLRAAWLNNASVGFFVGGFIIPYFGYMQQKLVALAPLEWEVFVVLATTWMISAAMRLRAITIIREIDDC